MIGQENYYSNKDEITDREQQVEASVLSLFLFGVKSAVTKDKYKRRLKAFFEYSSINGESMEEKFDTFAMKAKVEGEQWVFDRILSFIKYHLDRFNRKEITGSTIQNYIKSIKLFCDTADISVKWNKITRGLPKGKSYADDRIPTIAELQILLDYPDRRLKSIVYTMTSSGIRLGAWDFLKWGHIRPVTQNSNIVAAKILVYAGEDEEYFSFISRGAYYALKDWMDFRSKSGELIDKNSWLMRDLWDTQINCGTGLITKPKKLAPSGIKRLIERALWAQGLRKQDQHESEIRSLKEEMETRFQQLFSKINVAELR